MGARIHVAIVNRTAAMTSEGTASACAKRIKSEAVEVVRMAISRLNGRMKRALGSVIRQFYRLSNPLNIFLDMLSLQDYNFRVLPKKFTNNLRRDTHGF